MKVFWVIQGHTQRVNEVLENFKNIENVIWCTDDYAPPEHLGQIISSNVSLVTIPRCEPSFGNFIIHARSATAGIIEAKKRGADYVIKLRSDLVISDHRKFIEVMNLDGRLYGNCYVKHAGRFIEYEPRLSGSHKWLESFGDKLKNKADLNYVTDWIHYGPVDEVLLFYNGVIVQEPMFPVICEIRFLVSYFLNKGLDIDLSYEFVTKNMGLFMKDLYQNKVDLYSLKEKFNYSKMHDPIEPRALPEAFIP